MQSEDRAHRMGFNFGKFFNRKELLYNLIY